MNKLKIRIISIHEYSWELRPRYITWYKNLFINPFYMTWK